MLLDREKGLDPPVNHHLGGGLMDLLEGGELAIVNVVGFEALGVRFFASQARITVVASTS